MVQSTRARAVHGGTNEGFDGFQIQAAGLTQSGEDDPQKLIYFAGDLLTDRLGRFFSCGISVSSTGRA